MDGIPPRAGVRRRFEPSGAWHDAAPDTPTEEASTPILRFDDAPEFEFAGIRIRGLASPSRGAAETMTYRVELAGGQRLPEHTHDHEEVSCVLSGRWTVSVDGEETALGPGDTVVIPAGVTHGSHTAEGDEAVILTSMPVGTVLIRPDGERVSPPWGT